MKEELKPCPFCGSKAEEAIHWREHYGCSNESCGAKHASLTAEQWNMRPIPELGEKELDERDKKMIALALHGICMRQGPSTFDDILKLSQKLGIENLVAEYAKSWIGFSQHTTGRR